jgi:inner membrane protein
MDTITQALLGAACGNVCARHKLGKRAARWGAIAAALPDLDVVAALVWGPWAGMQHHRGVTHALWFGPVVGSAMGWLLWRRFARLRAEQPEHEDAQLGADDRLPWWMLALGVAMLSHPLLDVFTSYGTQIFAPFSNYRSAINGIGIIDPVYSLPLIIGLSLGKSNPRRKARASAVALGLTTAYLFFGLLLNHLAVDLATAELERAGVSGASVRAYPRALQIFQRRVVARSAGRIYVGQVSMFAPRPISWHDFREADHPLVKETRATQQGELFEWFAMNQTAARVEKQGEETIVEIDDMRYGDMVEPELSMWGIRARYRDGALVAPIERFRRRRRGGLGASFKRMMRDTFTPP